MLRDPARATSRVQNLHKPRIIFGHPLEFAEFLQPVKPTIFCIAEFLHADDHQLMSETLHKLQVGRRLRAAIEALDMTQTEVGNALGVAPSKLGNWLRGDNYPSAWFLKQFCDRYGVTADWLYRGVVTGMAADLADTLWESEQLALRDEARSRSGGREDAPPSRREAPAPVIKRRAAGCVVPVARFRGAV